jgi:hypothetical protein
LRLARCCSIPGLLALVALMPVCTSAQTAFHTEFNAPTFTNFAAPQHVLAAERFERYTILPCQFLPAPALRTTTTQAGVADSDTFLLTTALNIDASFQAQHFEPAAPACASSRAKYHLETSLTLSPANAEAFDATVGPSDEAPARENPILTAALSYEDSKIPHEGFHWWPALQQSFYFLLIEHGFRVADDPYLRYLLWHKPFWHDYTASTQHFYFNHWGDGDDFIVNYIGHPMEGGVTGNIQIANDPRGRSLTFGKSSEYWKSRFRAMAWAAVYSAQFEAGPILSEAAIGNEGGYFYKPGCDPYLTCSHPEKKPITNNTGWVDFTITPVVGVGWIVLEDALESQLTDRWAPGQPDDPLKFKLMRASLSPTHVMSNFVAGKVPWYRYRIYGPDGGNIAWWQDQTERPKFDADGDVQRWEIGAHYSYLSLPVATEQCSSCRVSNDGFGGNFAYRITNRLWVDSEVNYFPGSGSYGNKGSMAEGLFGPRYGYTGKNWGWYFKLRPGFIYYDKTLTIDTGAAFTEATRFAFDVGSVFEWFTSRHSTLRVDAGTTVVRYLTSHTDPRQPPGDILSTDYYTSQSNFQLSTGYTYRF